MLETISNLQPTPHELELELNPNSDAADMLCVSAEDSARIHAGRMGTNLLLQELTGRQQIEYARSLIDQSMLMSIQDGRYVRSDSDFSRDMWLGVKRSGGFIKEIVIVQNFVTVADRLGNLVVENGTCVEAITADKSYRGLREALREGISVAEVINDGGRIFAIETVADSDERTGLIGRIMGRPIIDPNLANEIAGVFSTKSDPGYHIRRDMGSENPVYSQLFYA